MSAPETNVDKQARRHRPALWGMAVAVAVGMIAFLMNIAFSVDAEDETIVDDAADAIVEQPPATTGG